MPFSVVSVARVPFRRLCIIGFASVRLKLIGVLVRKLVAQFHPMIPVVAIWHFEVTKAKSIS